MRTLPCLVLTLGACVGAPHTTSLRVHSAVEDAVVTVDDQVLGPAKTVAKRGVALPPGRHRVTVEKPGYFPYDELVEVKEGDPPIKMEAPMEKIPD